MLKQITALFLLAGAAPALAQASGSPAEGSKDDPNRIVCERYQETGSRLGSRKVCKTAREWEQHRAGTTSRGNRASKTSGNAN